jgi:hypothetical protein
MDRERPEPVESKQAEADKLRQRPPPLPAGQPFEDHRPADEQEAPPNSDVMRSGSLCPVGWVRTGASHETARDRRRSVGWGAPVMGALGPHLHGRIGPSPSRVEAGALV